MSHMQSAKCGRRLVCKDFQSEHPYWQIHRKTLFTFSLVFYNKPLPLKSLKQEASTVSPTGIGSCLFVHLFEPGQWTIFTVPTVGFAIRLLLLTSSHTSHMQLMHAMTPVVPTRSIKLLSSYSADEKFNFKISPSHFLWALDNMNVVRFRQHVGWLTILEMTQRCQVWKDCLFVTIILPLRSCPGLADGREGTSLCWPSSCSGRGGIGLHFGSTWRSNETCSF